jgi:hypothetical protein
MKKVLIFTLSILLLANIVAAANKPPKVLMATTVGIIKSIDMNNQSFVMEKAGLMRFLYAFVGLFGSKKSTDITVITTTETEFKKKTTEGVANGTFTDLAINQRVQVKGTYITEQTTTTTTSTSTSTTATTTTTPRSKIKATNVFILTPVQAALKKCQTDADCAWCGTNCLKKDLNRVCIQISPPEGYDCQCVNSVCKKVSSTTSSISTSTTTTIDKTCQQACSRRGFKNGICRSWSLDVPTGRQYNCNPNETEIGETKDCLSIWHPHMPGNIGKTCCCSKGKIETTD